VDTILNEAEYQVSEDAARIRGYTCAGRDPPSLLSRATFTPHSPDDGIL
jgi:hypothetical protein